MEGIPVSLWTVSRNSLGLVSSTVVGVRREARDRRFDAGFVGPRGFEVEPPLLEVVGVAPLGLFDDRPALSPVWVE